MKTTLTLVLLATALACTSASESPSTYSGYYDPCSDDIQGIETLNFEAPRYGYFSGSESTYTSASYLPYNLASCGSSSANFGVWYTFVGNGNTVTINTEGSDFDTYLKVYSCTGTELCVGYNDDECYSLEAQLEFPTEDGHVYFIFLTGYADAYGTYKIKVHEGVINCAAETTTNFSPFTSPDTNYDTPTYTGEDTQLSYTSPSDACGYYFFNTVDIGERVTGSTYAVHTTLPSAFPMCGSSSATEGRWYTFEGTGETVTVSLAHSSYDTYLKVYYCDGSSVSDGAVCVNYNDDCSNLNAAVTFNSVQGTYYYFFITGYMNQMGDFELLVERGDHGCGGAYSTSDMLMTTAPYNSNTY